MNAGEHAQIHRIAVTADLRYKRGLRSMLAIGLVGPAVLYGFAAAEHMHHHDPAPVDDTAEVAAGSTFGASVSLLAASYRHVLYEGDYQGLAAGFVWSRGRVAASAELAGYRLRRNGLVSHGIGDVMLHGMVTALDGGHVTAGGMLMVGLPTGNDIEGLGMGHVMVMPSAWSTLAFGRSSAMVTFGYVRGLGGANAHAKHGQGLWPIVDPMTMSELTAGAQVDHMLVPALGLGAKLAAAFPLDLGDTRVVGSLRAVWIMGRFQTSAEVQVGLAGDPFGFRGLMQTSATF